MGATILSVLGLLVMAGALLIVPLGLPGSWIMLAVVAVGAVTGQVGWTTVGLLAGLVALAEAAEFLLVRSLSLRYGGSGAAFWGAVAGGLVGVVVGAPVPVVGSLLAGVAGTFVGAMAVSWWKTREARAAARVGWGAVLGRAASAAVKTAAGIVVLVVGGGALFLG